MVRRRTAERGDIQDLIDVGEDILDVLEALKEDIRPVIFLAWVYIVLLLLGFIAVVAVVAIGASGE